MTAEHYVFCANGEHENPDERVVRAIFDSRLGPQDKRSTNPEVTRPFIFHLKSSSKATKAGEPREHMRAIERQARSAASTSGGQLTVQFLEMRSGLELKIG